MIDGELIFNTKIDQAGFNAGTKKITGSISKLKGSLKGLTKTAASSMPFVHIGRSQKNIAGLTSSLKGLAKVAAAAFSVKLVKDFASAAKEAYTAQEQAEVKLTTIMRQRMNATDDMIGSVKELAKEQQKLGVIGDEVQLAGAQQIATFLTSAESIKTLLPAMNDLLAQQQGLNATSSDAVNIGNLMGKVLQGQTSALKRVGISFSAAEEQVLKYGTESERAAMLAQVITNNVGHMNEALAQTDTGKQKQLANTMGDVKEQFGQAVIQLESVFLPLLSRAVSGLSKAAELAVTASSAIRSAFGVESGSGAAKTAASVAKSYESIAESAEATEEAQDGTLASFDKIIKLDNQQSTGADAAAASALSGAGASGTTAGATWADELKKSIDSGDWGAVGRQLAKKLNSVIDKTNWKSFGERIGNGITNAFSFAFSFLRNTHWVQLGTNFGDFLNGIIDKTDFSLIGRTLGARLNAGVGLALGFVKTFNWAGAGLGLANIITGWFQEVDWAQLGDTFGLYIQGLIEFGFNFVENLDFKEMAKNFSTAFNRTVDKIDTKKLGRTVSDCFIGVWDFIGTALEEIDWENVGKKISEFINGIDWRGILESLFKVLGSLIKAMPQLLKGLISNFDFENGSAFFALLLAPKMASALLSKFRTDSAVKASLASTGETIGTQVGGSTSSGFTSKFAAGLGAAKSVVAAAIIGWEIGSLIYQVAKPGIDKITDALSEAFNTEAKIAATESYIESQNKERVARYKEQGAYWLSSKDSGNERAISMAADQLGLAKIYDVDVSKVHDLWVENGYSFSGDELYEQVELALKALKKKNTKYTTTLPAGAQAKTKYTVTLPAGAPKLASGTVVPASYGEFAAILGDNKREAEVVSPLSTMKQALSEALSENGSKQPIVLNLMLDTRRGRKLLTQQVIDDINDMINSTGNVPINI